MFKDMSNNITAKIKGNQIPFGNIKVSGAKNSATRLLSAALIVDENIVLKNFPTQLVDAQYKFKFIEECGGVIEVDHKRDTIKIDSSNYKDVILEDYYYPIRTTYLLVPGLIKKNGRARVPYPGGCNIGNRGYDLHIMVWEKLGAKVIERENYIEVVAINGFISGVIDFPISTIGGTENALMCASIAKGTTIINNAYISPEVRDLINFLKSTGVIIKIVGNSYIEVTGQDNLKGCIHNVIPDRIEAITWIIYAVLTGGDITIEDIPFENMDIPLKHLKEAGIDFYRNSNNIHISPECLVNGIIQPFELATGTHPGIISDMQPFYVLLALHANGISRVYDYRYPERIKYCEELDKLYPGQLKWEKGLITINGKHDNTPKSSKLFSTDLRGSMALVMGALLADKMSEISNVEMALRGYNRLEEKLASLGVSIQIYS